jgi:hypothetical protein
MRYVDVQERSVPLRTRPVGFDCEAESGPDEPKSVDSRAALVQSLLRPVEQVEGPVVGLGSAIRARSFIASFRQSGSRKNLVRVAVRLFDNRGLNLRVREGVPTVWTRHHPARHVPYPRRNFDAEGEKRNAVIRWLKEGVCRDRVRHSPIDVADT